MATFFVLSLLFFTAGAFSIVYQKAVPSADILRQRFPNRTTFTGIVLWLLIIGATWFIVTHTTGFTRIASITTMLFFLLLFETLFLFVVRFVKSNIPAAFLSLAVAIVPFIIQYYAPTFALMNTVIILATMGATTLVIKLNYLRTKVILLLVVLFTINDVLNVRYLLPRLNLAPVTEPMRLLIFPTVTVGSHVVGSGDFMFLVLLTLFMLREFGVRNALYLVIAESVGLFLTGIYVSQHDVMLPFLTIMTPIFLTVYLVARTRRKRAPRSRAVTT
ncbi:MAG: hypothetical protein V1907_01030 [Candidatus Kerfeldbacteria bacterium]